MTTVFGSSEKFAKVRKGCNAVTGTQFVGLPEKETDTESTADVVMVFSFEGLKLKN